jgi:IstB-like ATP binding protein
MTRGFTNSTSTRTSRTTPARTTPARTTTRSARATGTTAQGTAAHHRHVVAELLLAECDDRDRRRSDRRIKAVGFPHDTWPQDFDFDANPQVNPATVHILAVCAWIRNGEPLCLI